MVGMAVCVNVDGYMSPVADTCHLGATNGRSHAQVCEFSLVRTIWIMTTARLFVQLLYDLVCLNRILTGVCNCLAQPTGYWAFDDVCVLPVNNNMPSGVNGTLLLMDTATKKSSRLAGLGDFKQSVTLT